MKRLAAHYVLMPDDTLLKQHYVELDDENRLLGVFPLDKEIANTLFYNGILMLRHCEGDCPKQSSESQHSGLLRYARNDGTLIFDAPSSVEIYLLERIDLLPPKFTANDCRSHSHIQRLG